MTDPIFIVDYDVRYSPIGRVMDALAHAERMAADCEHVLGETVRSVILHGSPALGDYVPGRSDIDLLAIVARPLSEAQTDELTRTLVAEQA